VAGAEAEPEATLRAWIDAADTGTDREVSEGALPRALEVVAGKADGLAFPAGSEDPPLAVAERRSRLKAEASMELDLVVAGRA